MAHYDDGLSLRDARALYFEANAFGSDGGYAKKWVDIELLGLKLRFPNTEARRSAVKFHDLHHVITGYDTDWAGETEISAFEIASGCGRYSAAWMLNLQAFFVGLFTGPRRMFAAFCRGRRARNLYHRDFGEALLSETVGGVRVESGLTSPPATPAPSDRIAFCGWWVVSAVVSLGFLALLLSPLLLVAWLLT